MRFPVINNGISFQTANIAERSDVDFTYHVQY